MPTATVITSVATVVQQAVAPVFLLTGVGAILTVLSGRLGRIIDRFRALGKIAEDGRTSYANEMRTLVRRAKWIHWAISLCTLSALFICVVVAALFIGSEFGWDPSALIAGFFIAAMLALIAGLLCFLREISLATGSIGLPKP